MSKYLDDIANLSPDWLLARLDEAVATHDMLPAAEQMQVKTMYSCMNLQSELHPHDDPPEPRFTARNDEVRRMMEVLLWLSNLTGSIQSRRTRIKLLWFRSRIRGDQRTGWRRIAKIIGTSHEKARYMHDHALHDLQRAANRVIHNPNPKG